MLGKGKSQVKSELRSAYGVFYLPRVTTETGMWVDEGASYLFSEFFKTLSQWTGTPSAPDTVAHPDQAINMLIQSYGLIAVIRDSEENLVYYSRDYRQKMPGALVKRVTGSLQISPHDNVLWSNDVFKAPEEIPAAAAIYGQKYQKPKPKPAPKSEKPKRINRREMGTKWAHPEELSPEEMDSLMGRGKTQPPA